MSVSKKTLAKNELWRRGNLLWKCHDVQKEMYNVFYSSEPNSISVWLLARQTGKSYLLCILALEQALRIPNSIIKLLTDTKIHIKSIFEPIFNEVLADCPEESKPLYNKTEYIYSFSNGSQIQLAGSDGGSYERLRGQKSSLVLVDEAGFCTDLEDIVKSVLLPTTTHTGGKIILASTPSADPNHDFNKFIEEAELNNTLSKKTIYDNPLLSQEQITRIIGQMGGVESVKFRREYMCEVLRDEDSCLFPEFNDDLISKIVRSDYPKPPYYHTYVGMDLGYDDLTAVLFAYYDFRTARLIFEDEIVVRGKELNLPKLTEAILKKEEELWTNLYTGEINKPLLRVSDINYIVTQEMTRHSQNRLSFQPAQKDDKQAAVHNFRVMLAAGQIIINPKCETFIRHLKNCKWSKNQSKKTFARSPDDGHYDTIDAAIYLARSVATTKNPYPSYYNMDMKNTYINKPEKFSNTPVHIYQKIFGIKGR